MQIHKNFDVCLLRAMELLRACICFWAFLGSSTRRTMSFLIAHLQSLGALVEICTMLDKVSQHKVEISPKYVGFEVCFRLVAPVSTGKQQRMMFYHNPCFIIWILTPCSQPNSSLCSIHEPYLSFTYAMQL